MTPRVTENPHGNPWAGSGNPDRHAADRWHQGYVAGLTNPRRTPDAAAGIHDASEEFAEGFHAAVGDLEASGVADNYAREIEAREDDADAAYELLQELRADERLTRGQKRHVGWSLPSILARACESGTWTPSPEEEDRVLRRLLTPAPVAKGTPGRRLTVFEERMERWRKDGVSDDELDTWLQQTIRSAGGGSGSVFSLHRAYSGGSRPEVWVARWSWGRDAKGKLTGRKLREAVRRALELPTPAEAMQGSLFEEVPA